LAAPLPQHESAGATAPDILVDGSHPGVVTIWLNAPEQRNAFAPGMMGRLADAVEREGAGECRLILIRGVGGSFCAGRSLRPGAAATADDSRLRLGEAVRLATAMYRCPKPTVAIVEGYAVGVGLSLALWCDFAIAEQGAKFAAPEVRLGFPPTLTAITLVRRLARPFALEVLLTGRKFDAQEALAAGGLRSVVPRDALDGAIQALVSEFEHGSPKAVAACKGLLLAAETLSFEEAIAAAARTSLDCEASGAES
jgi:methylglutaconyl-CoA hydratase